MALDREEVEEIVEATVTRTVPMAVSGALEKFGVDVKNPIEVQADHRFLRGARRFCESALFRIGMTLLLAAIGTVIGTNVWSHIKQ
jgi:hypothetical protein